MASAISSSVRAIAGSASARWRYSPASRRNSFNSKSRSIEPSPAWAGVWCPRDEGSLAESGEPDRRLVAAEPAVAGNGPGQTAYCPAARGLAGWRLLGQLGEFADDRYRAAERRRRAAAGARPSSAGREPLEPPAAAADRRQS